MRPAGSRQAPSGLNPETGVATARHYCGNHAGAKASGDILERRPEIPVDELKAKLVSECNAYVERLLELEPRMTLAKETHPNLACAHRDRLQELSRHREERSNRILQYCEECLKRKNNKRRIRAEAGGSEGTVSIFR